MTRQSRFEGTIGRTLADSQAWFDEPPHPGVGAPNVVVVLLDHTGFAQLGCYGSDIDTRHIDALAANPAGVKDGSAPLYGLAGVSPDRGLVGEFLVAFQDAMLAP